MTSSPQLQDPQLCFSSPVTFIIPSSCLLLSSSPLPVLVEAFSNFCVRQNLGWVGIQQSPSPSKSISYHSYSPSPTSSPQMAQLVGSEWVPPSTGKSPHQAFAHLSCYNLIIHQLQHQVQQTCTWPDQLRKTFYTDRMEPQTQKETSVPRVYRLSSLVKLE